MEGNIVLNSLREQGKKRTPVDIMHEINILLVRLLLIGLLPLCSGERITDRSGDVRHHKAILSSRISLTISD